MSYYDAILFTDLEGTLVPVKTTGAFKIASVLRQEGYSVKVINNIIYIMGNHCQLLYDYIDSHVWKNTMFIGFSTTFMQNVDVLKPLIERIYLRHPHVKIVVGGHGIKTKEILKDDKVDHWVRGLSENSVFDVISDKELPRIIHDPTHASSYNFHNSVPLFSKEDVVMPNEVLPLEVSRGCIFKCKFCSFFLLGRKYSDNYLRSEDSIYDELKFNYDHFGTTQYHMMCDTFNERTDKLLYLQRAIKRAKIDINFWAYMRLDLIHAYPEQIDLLKEMGVRNVFFGIESLHDPSSKAIGKGFGREKTIEMIHRLKEAWGKDVFLHGSFIVGLPHETPDTAAEWCEMLANRDIPFDSTGIGGLRIQPRGVVNPHNQSEFDRNAEDFGYTRTGKLYPISNTSQNWENKYWTARSAIEFAQHWHWKSAEKNPKSAEGDKGGHGRYMTLQTAGYTWEDVINNKVEESQVEKNGKVLYEKYVETVLNDV